MKYSQDSEIEKQVEIYLGHGRKFGEPGNLEACFQIGRIAEDCKIPIAPNLKDLDKKSVCDIIYGNFANEDYRAEDLAQRINELDGICAKVVMINSKYPKQNSLRKRQIVREKEASY